MGIRTTLCALLLVGCVTSAVPALAAAATTTTATAAAPLICIDPGHGGIFSNANANGLHERTVTLQIGLALRATLIARGYRVIMTRTTNTSLQTHDTETWNPLAHGLWAYARDHRLYYQQSAPHDDLIARARVANNAGADLYISIHCNASRGHSAHGTEVWTSPKDRLGRQLATLVQSGVVKRTGLHSRGTHLNDFYVLRWTNMPAVLVESAFITNRSDAAKLKKPLVRSQIASGIADGVDHWFATRPFHRTMARFSANSQESAAIALSRGAFPNGAETVVVARSDRATDTPGAPGLAVRLRAPLLLSARSVPTTATLAEIGRLHPKHVLFVGVAGAFDSAVTAAALASATVASSAVTMVQAGDRATLSALIALRMGAPGGGRVALVNARDDRAIMALVPVAARTGMPILLTGDTTATAAATYLAAENGLVRTMLLVGSRRSPASVVTTAVKTKLHYADAARIAYVLDNRAFTSRVARSMQPIVVNGSGGGDVFTGAMRGARLGQPVLVLSGTVMPPYTRLFITNRRAQIRAFTLLDSNHSLAPLVDAVLTKCASRASSPQLNLAVEPIEGLRVRVRR